MSANQLLSQALTSALHADDAWIVMGEDVADGGLLGLTRGLADDASTRARLWATPLCPASVAAQATGACLAGKKVVWLPTGDEALRDALPLWLEAMRVARAAGASPRMVTLVPTAPQLGEQTNEEGALFGLDGVTLRVASDAPSAAAQLTTAMSRGEGITVIRCGESVLFSAETEGSSVPSTARLLADGERATVFTWGDAVEPTLRAVEETGVEVTVIELTQLWPVPPSLMTAVRSTGRVLITHPGDADRGAGQRIAARIADEAILYLDAPVLCVGAHDERSAHALPSVDSIATALARVAFY